MRPGQSSQCEPSVGSHRLPPPAAVLCTNARSLRTVHITTTLHPTTFFNQHHHARCKCVDCTPRPSTRQPNERADQWGTLCTPFLRLPLFFFLFGLVWFGCCFLPPCAALVTTIHASHDRVHDRVHDRESRPGRITSLSQMSSRPPVVASSLVLPA
jgi:hypothetical protein